MLPDYLIECPNILKSGGRKDEQFYCMDWWKEVT